MYTLADDEVTAMSNPRSLKGVKAGLGGLLIAGRKLLGSKPEEPESSVDERRVNRRVPLRIPVKACVGTGKFRDCQIVDINLRGFAIEAGEEAEPGATIAVAFAGLPEVAPRFTLAGNIVRRARHDAVGVQVDRGRNSTEVLTQYRNLVRYYLRHKPLLDELRSGYFEARCPTCGWMGRVGKRSPTCSRCNRPVEPLKQ